MTVLETERLLVRELSSDDAAFVRMLLNEPSFLHFIGERGVRTFDAAHQYIQYGPGRAMRVMASAGI